MKVRIKIFSNKRVWCFLYTLCHVSHLKFYPFTLCVSFLFFYLSSFLKSFISSVYTLYGRNKTKQSTHESRGVFFGILCAIQQANCTLKLERMAHALCIHCTPLHRLDGWGGCMRCAWPWPWTRRR